MEGYRAWSTNRGGSDKGGGGLTLLYRDSLTTHQYLPDIPTHLEHIRNERQWLLVNSGQDKIAFLHTYIACQNNRDDSFLSWNEDLFFLLTQEATRLRQQGFTILAMGDFTRVSVLLLDWRITLLITIRIPLFSLTSSMRSIFSLLTLCLSPKDSSPDLLIPLGALALGHFWIMG